MPSYVLSAAYSESISGKTVHRHHDCHQLLYIVEGEALVTVNGKEYTAKSGSLLIFSRFEQHSVAVKSNAYKRYSVTLSPETGAEAHSSYPLYSILVNRADGFKNLIETDDKCCEIETLFKGLTEEFKAQSRYRNEMLDSLLKQLLIVVCRLMPLLSVPENSGIAGVVYNIQRMFENDCGQQYSLDVIAEENFVSNSYLSHVFKEITGISCMRYLLQCRVNHAKNLLAETDLSIGAIVGMCGFSDESNFGRTFRRETGLTPSAFRRECKEVE